MPSRSGRWWTSRIQVEVVAAEERLVLARLPLIVAPLSPARLCHVSCRRAPVAPPVVLRSLGLSLV
eukprot:7724558-Pyramimonas_sp.AAC.1